MLLILQSAGVMANYSSHTYLGYALKVRGSIGCEGREFLVGVGEGAHAKHHFRAGDNVSGDALPVADPRLETVEFYKVSNLRLTVREVGEETPPLYIFSRQTCVEWWPLDALVTAECLAVLPKAPAAMMLTARTRLRR